MFSLSEVWRDVVGWVGTERPLGGTRSVKEPLGRAGFTSAILVPHDYIDKGAQQLMYRSRVWRGGKNENEKAWN